MSRKQRFQPDRSPQHRQNQRQRGRQNLRQLIRHPFRVLLILLSVIITFWLAINAVNLRLSAMKPTDAFLVLGGSIRREIYVAELAKQNPTVPILISQGSQDPCIWLIFERAEAPMPQVWLEKCANSTFGNFYFSLPILQRWNVRRVKVITSGSHVSRAMGLARIILGAHGIWVEPEAVSEQGIPANQESWIKTSLDIVRGMGWAIVSQIYQPQCPDLISLSSVSLEDWQQKGFECEHQGGLEQ